MHDVPDSASSSALPVVGYRHTAARMLIYASLSLSLSLSLSPLVPLLLLVLQESEKLDASPFTNAGCSPVIDAQIERT